MIEVELYGKKSRDFEFIRASLENFAKSKGIELRVRLITDTGSILRENILNIPSVKIGSEIRAKFSKDTLDFSNEINEWIIENYHYQNSNNSIE